MEHKRETDIEDYWLIQYQRLLESKPLTLLEKVRFLFFPAKSYSNQCIIWAGSLVILNPKQNFTDFGSE